MSRDKNLMTWITTLDREQLRSALFDCIDRLIDIEEVSFHEMSKSPYWDCSGDRLDASEDKE
jgi:hypothetical protein